MAPENHGVTRRRRPARGARLKPQVSVRAPASGDTAAFLAAVRRSRALHRGWVTPPATPAAYRRDLQRRSDDEHRGFLEDSAKAAEQVNRAAGKGDDFTEHFREMHGSLTSLEGETDIRTAQEWLGHQSVATTQIYTHAMKQPGIGVHSPLDG